MFHFYTNLKLQKIKGFLIFSGGKEMEYWLKWAEFTQAVTQGHVQKCILKIGQKLPRKFFCIDHFHLT